MEKFRNWIFAHIPFLIVVGVFIIFNIAFWPSVSGYLKDPGAHANFWASFAFLMVAFCAVGAISFTKLRTKNAVVTIVPIFAITVGYIVLSLIFNIIMMAVDKFNPHIVITCLINAILMIGFIILFLIFARSKHLVEEKTIAREERMDTWSGTFSDAYALQNFTTNETLKKALAKFADNIKMSSSRSTEKTVQIEGELNEQIVTIKSLLKNDAEEEQVLKAVQIGEALLVQRNQILTRSK
jgi:hypothetical protein